MINTEKTIQRVRRMLGEPIVQVELDDEQMASLLKDAQETFYLYAELAEMPISKQDKIEYQWIKKYFYASCKEALARVRGKFSGKIPVPGQESLQLDYKQLIKEADKEKCFLRYVIFKDEELLKCVNPKDGILVFYVNVGNIEERHVREYMAEIAKSLETPEGFRVYYIPVRDHESKVECIYPDIADNKKGSEILEKLGDYLDDFISNKKKDEE